VVDWKLTFLGTAASAVTVARNPTAVLLTLGTKHILFEGPEGTTRRLLEAGIDLRDIEKVFISHGHNDHLIGIVTFLWQNVLVANRTNPLEIIAPGYVHMRIKELLKLTSTPDDFIRFYMPFSDIDADESFSEYELDFTSRQVSLPGLRVIRSHAPLVHDPPARATRLDITDDDGNRILSFCFACDTSPCDNVVRLAAGVDYLIHEATLLDEDIEHATKFNHSTPSGAGRIASEAGVKTLVIVHYSTILEGKEDILEAQASSVFGGKVIVARDLMELP
jgi:ribonuclease Z